MTRRFADLPGPRTSSVLTDRSILVLPIGAIEHHGPHLPLSTDALVAEAVAAAAVDAAAEAGLDTWLLPTLSVGKSDEHAGAPGTLWLSAETLLAVLRDVGRSLTTTPARTLVFVNGHGGNAALLQVANRELRRLFGLRTFTTGTGIQTASDAELGFGIHAGWSETAVVMHLAPDLVDESAFVANVPTDLAGFDLIGFNGKPVTFGWLSDDFGPSGVIGDPTGATATAGAELFEQGVASVVAALREIDRFPRLP